MYPPKVKLENFVQDSKSASSQRMLSKSLFNFLAAIQLCFGFNFGLGGSFGKFKSASFLMTTAAGCVMILTLFLSVMVDKIGSYYFLVYFVQYIPFFAVLLRTKYTLCDFLSDLMMKNQKNPVSKNDKLGMFVWLYTSLMFGAKFATAIVYCSLTSCSNSRWLVVDIVIHIPIIALDIIPVVNFIIFYHVFTRLREMRTKYEHRDINLQNLQASFKEVADDFERFRFNYDTIFVWGFLTESSKWMIIIWNHLTLIKLSSSWWLYGCSYIWAASITVQICVPAVFAEMITVETDAMKMNLHDKLLIETDEAKCLELTRLLRYISARPLLHKAWRLVPVDLRLPVTLLSICTTYLIVIIQFTHLYD